jgi:CD109 antigen
LFGLKTAISYLTFSIKYSCCTNHDLCLQVGEYLILHIQSNTFVESFSYVVLAKGVVLYAGQERMASTIHTMALTLSPEMAPAATVLVYQPTSRGVALADALTFPVDGISRHNVILFMKLSN